MSGTYNRESLIYDETNLILSKTSSAQLINYYDSGFSSLSQRHSSTFTILISTGKVMERPVPKYTKWFSPRWLLPFQTSIPIAGFYLGLRRDLYFISFHRFPLKWKLYTFWFDRFRHRLLNNAEAQDKRPNLKNLWEELTYLRQWEIKDLPAGSWVEEEIRIRGFQRDLSWVLSQLL